MPGHVSTAGLHGVVLAAGPSTSSGCQPWLRPARIAIRYWWRSSSTIARAMMLDCAGAVLREELPARPARQVRQSAVARRVLARPRAGLRGPADRSARRSPRRRPARRCALAMRATSAGIRAARRVDAVGQHDERAAPGRRACPSTRPPAAIASCSDVMPHGLTLGEPTLAARSRSVVNGCTTCSVESNAKIAASSSPFCRPPSRKIRRPRARGRALGRCPCCRSRRTAARRRSARCRARSRRIGATAPRRAAAKSLIVQTRSRTSLAVADDGADGHQVDAGAESGLLVSWTTAGTAESEGFAPRPSSRQRDRRCQILEATSCIAPR